MSNSNFEIMKKLKQIMNKKDNMIIGTEIPIDTNVLWIKPNTSNSTFEMFLYIIDTWVSFKGSVSIDLSSLDQNILPKTASTYNLGSEEKPFKTIYADEARISANTLYIDGVPVLGSYSDSIIGKADQDQGIEVRTSGTGNAKVQSEANTEIIATGTGGNVNVKATGAGGNVNITSNGNINLSAQNINADGTFTIKDLTILNNLTVSGTTTTVNSTNLNIKDNIIELNKGETGNGVSLERAGIKIDRGELDPVYIVFDETDDSYKVGTLSSLKKIATEEFVNSEISKISTHIHTNKTVIDKFSEDESGNLLYDNTNINSSIKYNKMEW